MGHLTLEQRYKIEAYKSLREIADYVGKNKSVISRELKRNSDYRNGTYRAAQAERKAKDRHHAKTKAKRFNATVQAHVLHYLEQDYSPEQIAARASLECVGMVSHERIYQYIWSDKKREGKLYKHLRTKGKRYRKRGSKKDSRGLITNRVDIDERPNIVDKK